MDQSRPQRNGLTLEMVATLLADSEQREIFLAYRVSVHGACLKVLRNPSDAEDACHDVFFRLFRYLESGKANPKTPLEALLRMLTKQCLRDFRRSQAVRAVVPYETSEIFKSERKDFDADHALDERDARRMIDQLKGACTPAQRNLLTSRLETAEDVKTSQLAVALGITDSTYRQHLKDVRDKASFVFAALNKRVKG